MSNPSDRTEDKITSDTNTNFTLVTTTEFRLYNTMSSQPIPGLAAAGNSGVALGGNTSGSANLAVTTFPKLYGPHSRLRLPLSLTGLHWISCFVQLTVLVKTDNQKHINDICVLGVISPKYPYLSPPQNEDFLGSPLNARACRQLFLATYATCFLFCAIFFLVLLCFSE